MATSRDQLLQSAEKHVARGKLDQALKDYLRVLDDNPKDINTLNKVGDLYVRMSRPSDSIPFFIRIADFYSRDGFFLKAIAIYKKINKIDPARLEVYDRLADLYHKQGLTQDARSQYQVLADHYLKNNKPEEAIAAYKKMASVDPNDLKIQVRLADLYRNNRQIDQAVMQYGLIGSMLLRRGAHDEAAAVFQKALELSPNDAGIQKSLVRSLIAQKNPSAAIAILKAAPRTADSLALLAEAQLELDQRADASRTAEQAIALDARHEPARLLLSRVRIEEGGFDQALAVVTPLVDAFVEAREFSRAAGFLTPIVQAEPAHQPTLVKLAEVREAEGNVGEAVRMRLAVAREQERRGDPAGAVASYQRVLQAIPDHAEALGRVRELSPGALPPKPPPVRPAVAVTRELVVDVDEAEPATAAPTEPARALPPGMESRPAEEQEIETLVVEAEVFAKYGLTDKAVERLRALVRRRPDLLRARERLVELMQESQNPALKQEAAGLIDVYVQSGDTERARTLASRVGLSVAEPVKPAEPAPAAMLAPAAPPAPPEIPIEIAFDEFEIEPALDSGAAVEEIGSETIRLSAADVLLPEPPSIAPAPPAASAPRHASSSETIGSADSEFVSYEELGSLLDEEMQKAGETTAQAAPRQAAPVVDEHNLFADEQQFFNLAEELEKELADEAPPPAAPDLSGPGGEASLEEIFREFKKGVEQQLSAEDYETHFNLGIAYKEMGLIDEGIGEFQLASKDPRRAVECCSMLGLCFLEKGMPQLAIKWYRKGLETPEIRETEMIGLLYDLACIYQSTGDVDVAYRTFLEVYGLNTNYRDVAHRVRELETVKRN